MAQAARYNVDHGAQIIDINMGCPAKKVCNVMAGSALMQDEPLVARILEAVVKAPYPETPVTLKFRTGWNRANRNAPTIARIAEASGVRAIAIHGRTRADQYQGCAEYDTIALVKSQVGIPVIANGDITSPQKAARCRIHGRRRRDDRSRRQGRPWLFREIEHFLPPDHPACAHAGGSACHPARSPGRAVRLLRRRHRVRIARKHIGWYTEGIPGAAHFRHAMNQLQSADAQLAAADEFFPATRPPTRPWAHRQQ